MRLIFEILRSFGGRNETVDRRTRRRPFAPEMLESRSLLSAIPPFAGGSLPKAQAYVTALYQNLLGRNPDPQGLAGFSNSLASGKVSAQKLVQSIVGSNEYRSNQVTYSYMNILGRTPDSQGLAAGVNLLSRGGTVNQLQVKLLGSDEFLKNTGGTKANFIATVYDVTLGRNPEPAALNANVDPTNSASRSKFVTSIVNSGEAAGSMVTNLYYRFLGRQPDAAAQNSSKQLAASRGGAFNQVVTSLVTSNEYITNKTKSA